jgi:hypothetical protein
MQVAWRWQSDFRVRSFLDILEKERMIERTANAGKTHIIICNYSKFQDVERKENAETNEQETQGQRKENALKIPIHQNTKDISSFHSDIGADRIGLTSENTHAQKAKKPKMAEPGLGVLLDVCVPPQILEDWRAVRKAKRAGPITETVADALIREAEKAGLYPAQAVQIAAERGWQSFKAEWISANPRASPTQSPPRRGSAGMFDALQEIRKEMEHDERNSDLGQSGSAFLRIPGG